VTYDSLSQGKGTHTHKAKGRKKKKDASTKAGSFSGLRGNHQPQPSSHANPKSPHP